MGPTYADTFMILIGFADCLIYMKFGNIYLLDFMHSPLQGNNDLPALAKRIALTHCLTENTIYNKIGFGWSKGFYYPYHGQIVLLPFYIYSTAILEILPMFFIRCTLKRLFNF